jgi:hypothetical protein
MHKTSAAQRQLELALQKAAFDIAHGDWLKIGGARASRVKFRSVG